MRPGVAARIHGFSRPLTDSHGFSLLEVVSVIAFLAVVAVLAMPPINRMRSDASVQNARHSVVSVISLARATALRFGRPAVLRVDASGDRMWVEVDTSVVTTGNRDTLRILHLDEKLHVDLTSDREALCFDGRGLAATTTECPQTGAEIVISRLGQADTVIVSTVGRVLP